jgi:hypothetical protein
MTKRVMRVPTPSPPLQGPGGVALSDSEKAEALADSLEAQFQPVDDPSDAAFTEIFDVAMRAYEHAPASEPILTTLSEVLKVIEGLKVGKTPGPNGITNRFLRHLPKRAITFLTKVVNAVIRRQYPPVWKHARLLPILKPRKDPTQPSSYRPLSFLDTVGKLFEKILLSRVLRNKRARAAARRAVNHQQPSENVSKQQWSFLYYAPVKHQEVKNRAKHRQSTAYYEFNSLSSGASHLRT